MAKDKEKGDKGILHNLLKFGKKEKEDVKDEDATRQRFSVGYSLGFYLMCYIFFFGSSLPLTHTLHFLFGCHFSLLFALNITWYRSCKMWRMRYFGTFWGRDTSHASKWPGNHAHMLFT